MTCYSGQEPTRFDFLDLARGLAATSVLLYHNYDVLGQQVMWHGYLAVDFFFMLSGFVLCHKYDSPIVSGLAFSTFFIRRLIRLYPCYLLAFLIVTALQIAQLCHGHQAGSLGGLVAQTASNLLVTPAPMGSSSSDYLFPSNPVAWSLMYELLVSAMYWYLRRSLNDTQILWVFSTVTVLFIAAACYYGGIEGGWGRGQMWIGLPRTLFAFLAGVLLRHYLYSATPSRWGGLRATAALVVFLMILHSAVWSLNLPYEIAATILVFPILLLELSRAAPLGRLESSGRLARAYSYPVYILQIPAGQLVSWTMLPYFQSAGGNLLVFGSFQVALTAVTALLISAGLEVPLRGWFRDRLGVFQAAVR